MSDFTTPLPIEFVVDSVWQEFSGLFETLIENVKELWPSELPEADGSRTTPFISAGTDVYTLSLLRHHSNGTYKQERCARVQAWQGALDTFAYRIKITFIGDSKSMRLYCELLAAMADVWPTSMLIAAATRCAESLPPTIAPAEQAIASVAKSVLPPRKTQKGRKATAPYDAAVQYMMEHENASPMDALPAYMKALKRHDLDPGEIENYKRTMNRRIQKLRPN